MRIEDYKTDDIREIQTTFFVNVWEIRNVGREQFGNCQGLNAFLLCVIQNMGGFLHKSGR